MKTILFFSCLLLATCSKEDKPTPDTDKDEFQFVKGPDNLLNRRWVTDSGMLTQNGIRQKINLQSGTYLHLEFSETGKLKATTESGFIQQNYSFGSPDTIFLWTGAMNKSKYVLIRELTGDFYHSSDIEPGTDNVYEWYHHAE